MIRRGREKEALELAQESFASGYPAAVARRLKRRKYEGVFRLRPVCVIPAKIREYAERELKNDPNAYALARRDELLITWLMILPWRQNEIRALKVGSRRSGANLFVDRIRRPAATALPGWVEEARRHNSRERFWQFCTCDKDTRTVHATHALLPKRLVAPLEQYLGQHRPLFVKGRDPGNLFLNQNGSASDASSFTRLVGTLTRHHIGKRVTPGGFRHSFALKWSEERPMDILTLSKILRLHSVQTSVATVGPSPNEALCVQRVEAWIERREMAARSRGTTEHQIDYAGAERLGSRADVP